MVDMLVTHFLTCDNNYLMNKKKGGSASTLNIFPVILNV